MRYHSTVPLSSHSPHYLVELSSQRSNPTCSLSLANISAASGKALSESKSQAFEMETDPSNVLIVPVESADKRCSIPFPKRPHSLLRTTTSILPPIGDPSKVERSEDTSLQDQDPPRKRTRTSALSTSTRSRPRRPASLHSRNSSTSATTPRSIAPLSISPPTASLSVTFPLVTSSHDLRPQSDSVPFPSISSTSISCAASTSSVYSSSTLAPSSFSLLTWPSTNWYRKRTTAGEMRSYLYLYRTLVYGLEVKYHDRHRNLRGTVDIPAEEAASYDARIKSRSCFDVQDALLAQHLKHFLLIHGADVRHMVVNVDEISREGIHDDDLPMDIDNKSNQPSIWSTSDDFLHPHLHPSTNHSIISYQQLVATLMLRHHFQTTGRPREKSDRQPGKRSLLAECINLE